MFNFVESKCYDCGKKFLMSISEKEVFGNGYCQSCMDETVRHIRFKVVSGFYNLPEITQEIANDIVEKELKFLDLNANKLVDSEIKKFERRRSPRIIVNEVVK